MMKYIGIDFERRTFSLYRIISFNDSFVKLVMVIIIETEEDHREGDQKDGMFFGSGFLNF